MGTIFVDNIKDNVGGKELNIGDGSLNIDSSGKVGIGTNSPSSPLHISGSNGVLATFGATTELQIYVDNNEISFRADADNDENDTVITFDTDGSEKMRIEGGHLLIGTTNDGISASSSAAGINLKSNGAVEITRDDNPVVFINRNTSKGTLLDLRQAGSTFAKMGIDSGNDLQIHSTASSHTGLQFGNGNITPLDNTGADLDNVVDLGAASIRFDDIHATNGTIQTSDENEKQDISNTTTKELNVAKKLSALFKTFRWKDRVTEKGETARTHSGIIAQEVQSAFSAEGLDATKYALFTSTTWWEKDEIYTDTEDKEESKPKIFYTESEAPSGATKKTRLGVRYPELFSFIFSSIDARLTALESK